MHRLLHTPDGAATVLLLRPMQKTRPTPPRPLPKTTAPKAQPHGTTVLDELLLRLAMEIDQATDPKTIAPLSARLIDVLDRVEDADTDSQKGGSFLDELTARRAQRPEAG